jgi:branched-chain amino acid transport system substrate-binding protein
MKKQLSVFSGLSSLVLAVSLVFGAQGLMTPARAATPIKVAVLAPPSIKPGQEMINAARLAEKDINDAGGINGRPVKVLVYDSKLSSTGAVNAMKKAVLQDHVVAVTGGFASGASMSLMPYAKRMKVPLILESGTAKIGKLIHKHYNRYENVFQLQINSYFLAKQTCAAAHDLFVKGHKGKVPAVIMTENVDWTHPLNRAFKKCLPRAGIKVDKRINYSVKTKDYGPIYSAISALHPRLIIVGMAHTGAIPVVQWHQNHVPALMIGFNMQGTSGSFWKATNGAAQGIIDVTAAAGGVNVTPKTPAFYKAYKKRFHNDPVLQAYTAYDSVLAVADAIKKAGSTQTAAIVKQLENMNMTGVIGHIKFTGPDARFAHVPKFGPGFVQGVAFQWQHGKQVVVWPKKLAQGKLEYPDFVPSQ